MSSSSTGVDAAPLAMNVHDLPFEQDLARNPYSLKNWLFYLDFKSKSGAQERFALYDRAVRVLPGSYKLWFRYLTERKAAVAAQSTHWTPHTEKLYAETNTVFERALAHMAKMPRIWLEYVEFLVDAQQPFITHVRSVFDRALQSLPPTQHHRIWPKYLEFARECKVPDTAIHIFERYLIVHPLDREPFYEYLKSVGRLEEAAQQMVLILNNPDFVTTSERTKYDMWMEFLRLVTKNPRKITKVDVEAVVRGGLRQFTSEAGKLWVSLAQYYMRLSMFEKARDVFEEAIRTVRTVRDFRRVFDAYSEFMDGLLDAQMAALEDAEQREERRKQLKAKQRKKGRRKTRKKKGKEEADEDDDDDEDMGRDDEEDGMDAASLQLEVDLCLEQLDDLMQRQPLLLNDVKLRQNPHNVSEWEERVKLFEKEGDLGKVLLTYTQAVTTVDPHKATCNPEARGKRTGAPGELRRARDLHDLWLAFARFYEEHDRLDDARTVLQKATLVDYRSVVHLEEVWCAHAEMELRHGSPQRALAVLKQACRVPPPSARLTARDAQRPEISVQRKLYRRTRLWAFLADLEESFGSLESTKAAYDSMIELRIITPALLLSYAAFLRGRNFFEQSFRVFEKGVAVFHYPVVYPIWCAYLKQFIARFQGSKLERTRDLFEESLVGAEGQHLQSLYLLYADFERQFGGRTAVSRCMKVFERACAAVDDALRRETFQLHAAAALQLCGLDRTRAVYDRAMEKLSDKDMKGMCLEYAELERRVGDVDRVRAIYTYGAQFCNPSVHTDYWKTWDLFERDHGNRDTFTEMLRVRRSVAAQYATVSTLNDQLLTGAAAAGNMVKSSESLGGSASAAAAAAEASESNNVGVKRKRNAMEELDSRVTVTEASANPEEMDIDDDDDDEEEEEEDDDGDTVVDVKVKAVPDAVYGSAFAAESS